jgi:hypothetical protein
LRKYLSIERLLNPFTRHPASVGETYVSHAVFAARCAIKMILGGSACLVHGILLFAFSKTASRCVSHLHNEFEQRLTSYARKKDQAPNVRARTEP